MLNTPILFLVFNRLETTTQVFAQIRKAQPRQLFIGADGARVGKEGEAEKVQAVRQYILDNIDWDCEVKTLFREQNLGCGVAPAQAITWFFEHVEQGIILEDDILPEESFFLFCEELLELYKNDERIFLISGYNKQGTWNPDHYDYFFSNMGGIWGWASWARAWKHFDFDMSDIDDFIKRNNFVYLLGNDVGEIRQNTIYSQIIKRNVDAWDYQWGYARHKNNGLSCVSAKNLVLNIGFGEDATHTKARMAQPDTHELVFPLKANPFVVPDREYDKKYIDYSHKNNKPILNMRQFIKKVIYKLFGKKRKVEIQEIVKQVKKSCLSYLSETALNNIYEQVSNTNSMEGIIIEAGCALGGSAIVIASAKDAQKKFYVYDVFGMIPPPSEQDDNDVHERYKKISNGLSEGLNGEVYYGYRDNLLDVVKDNFHKLEVETDANILFVKGLYQDTLRVNDAVSFAHIDCDWYESVMICLSQIVPKLVIGGRIIVDDYADWSGCRKAVDEYFLKDKTTGKYTFIHGEKLLIIRNK